MIPQFPNFKKLELSDKADIDKYVTKFEPYSDFNFIVTWTWAHEWDPQVSYLNGNLVFRWAYEGTKQPIYCFLGNNLVTETCDKLFHYMETKNESGGTISYVPEVSLSGIDFTNYYIGIDIDACDYIYNLATMAALTGNGYSQKRGRANHFKINYPEAKLVEINYADTDQQKEIFDLSSIWVENKTEVSDFYKSERNSLERFFEARFQNVFCFGIYTDRLIGYAIFSSHGKDYVINHYIKADVAYKGVYEYLMKESARLLNEKGFSFLNHLEDLGVEGLRQAKMAYRPINFLRKYHIKKL